MAAGQEAQFSKLFEEASGTQAFSDAMKSALEAYLNATQVSRENVERYLTAANLPTRAEISRLSERVDELTTRIDDLIRTLKPKKKKKKR